MSRQVLCGPAPTAGRSLEHLQYHPQPHHGDHPAYHEETAVSFDLRADTNASSSPYHNVEELCAKHGIELEYLTVFCWVQPFTPLIDAARPCRHTRGERWFVDETYVDVSGRVDLSVPRYRQPGQLIDDLVAEKPTAQQLT
jgi:transposase-like protein